MNVQSLIDSEMIIVNDNGTYMNASYKDILAMYNALNPDHTIKLGTLRTYSDRHHWKSRSELAYDSLPVEDEY